MSFARLMFGPVVLGVVLFSAGCDNTLALPAAGIPNDTNTVTLHALQGTPINAPSGFDVIRGVTARTDDQSEGFDIAFDIDDEGRALIFTTGALGLNVRSAIQTSDRAFGDIVIAPLEDYGLDSVLVVGVDSVFIVRSRPASFGCIFFLGQLPRYGKFHVLDLNLETRQITLKNLVNMNCGYRGLEIGLPTR
jgi:hypothetical protein